MLIVATEVNLRESAGSVSIDDPSSEQGNKRLLHSWINRRKLFLDVSHIDVDRFVHWFMWTFGGHLLSAILILVIPFFFAEKTLGFVELVNKGLLASLSLSLFMSSIGMNSVCKRASPFISFVQPFGMVASVILLTMSFVGLDSLSVMWKSRGPLLFDASQVFMVGSIVLYVFAVYLSCVAQLLKIHYGDRLDEFDLQGQARERFSDLQSEYEGK